MKKDDMHKAFTALLVIIVLMCAAVLIKANTSKNEESSFEPDPLIINTEFPEEDVLLTVIDQDGQEVFQYIGDINIWKSDVENRTYMNLYLDDAEVNQ